MDKTNTNNTNNTNKLKLIDDPFIFISLIAILVFMIIMLFLILFNVDLSFSGKIPSSNEQQVKNTFIILFFTLLVVFLFFMFLPRLKELKSLFNQISNVFYVIIFTIFFILFYILISENILNNYYYLINPIMFCLAIFSFYKSLSHNYIEDFNIGYERIKMIILLFCLISIIITFYNINPGGSAEKYFGYSLLLTIILAVFGFLYLIIIMTLPGEGGRQKENLISNFSSFGTYGSALFLLFLTVVTIIISRDKDKYFSNKQQIGSVVLLSLLISILWSFLLFSNLNDNSTNPYQKIGFLSKSLLVLFGLIISGLIIFWISYNIERLSGKSSIVTFVLNLLLVALIIGLIYKTIYVKLPVGNSHKNAFFSLIMNTIFYIPCLISGVFDWFGKKLSGEYNATNTGSLIMLLVAIVLIVLYFKSPSLFNIITTQGGKQLVNKPVYTDSQYNLGSYIDLNGSDNLDYQYAISCWIYIDSAPPNTNSSYSKYTSLLNFGNKPNILYNGEKHSLMITMQQKDLKNVTKNKLTDFDDEGNRIIYIDNNILLQKWNNIIINYNGGTLDIFINGELVKSSIESVPYYTLDNLTIGENNGIKGGICNVIYFRRSLTAQNIYYIYDLIKNKDPPTLNDSNDSILVKNINQSVSFNSG
jgi:hypothetical protein